MHSDGSAGAKAAVTQGSVVVRAAGAGSSDPGLGRGCRTAGASSSGGSVVQGTGWCQRWLWLRWRQGERSVGPRQGWLRKRLGKGGDGVNEKSTPPLFL